MKENLELRNQLETVTGDYVEAIQLLNDITNDLAEVAGKESEIRQIQSDLDPVVWENSSDLRKRIFEDLESIDSTLKKSRSKQEELASAANDNPRLAAYKSTVDNLQQLLDEKEKTIAALRSEVESLAAQAATLQQENREKREEIVRLQDEARATDDTIASQQRTIGVLRDEAGFAYYFVGSKDEIEAARRRGDLEKTWRTVHATDAAMTGEAPRSFQRISLESEEVPLGYSKGEPKILSTHKRHKPLYDVVQVRGTWLLRLREPLAFWRASRYLVVEIRRR